MARSMLAAVPLLLALARRANAQASGAVCQTQFDWMRNSLHQDPCIVASYLQGVCAADGETWTVPGLTSSTSYYTGPTTIQQNNCTCNVVVYNLLSACTDCQGSQNWLNWRTYSGNCSAFVFTSYPKTVPSGTEIPSWATYDDSESTWSEQEAYAAALSASPTVHSKGSGSLHIGAIAGGAAGGAVLIFILLGVLLYFCRCRGRNKNKKYNGPVVDPSGGADARLGDYEKDNSYNNGGGHPTAQGYAPPLHQNYGNQSPYPPVQSPHSPPPPSSYMAGSQAAHSGYAPTYESRPTSPASPASPQGFGAQQRSGDSAGAEPANPDSFAARPGSGGAGHGFQGMHGGQQGGQHEQGRYTGAAEIL